MTSQAVNVLANIKNPFGHAVVSDAWDSAGIDVPEINTRAFETCLAAFDRVSSGQGSESILLHGPAGSGKTHLLGRLQHRLVTEQAATAPDGALRSIFINVKLQTSPQMLWQHLRRRMADDLLRVTSGASQLQRLVAHYLAAASPEQSARSWVMQIRVLTTVEEHHEHVESLLDTVAEKARLDYELRRVLSHLVFRRNLAEARGWLRGDPLPEAALARLGLTPAPDSDPEDKARELILSLCRLAEDSLPMVLCFDQVEALQAHKGDLDAFYRLGRHLADLFDSDNNILLIACLQSVVLGELMRGARDADWERFARRETTLDPLDDRLGGMLLQRRLDAVPELHELRRGQPDRPLWPLPPDQVASLFQAQAKVPARRILTFASQLFDELAAGRATHVAQKPGEFLSEELERRLGPTLGRYQPSDTDENLSHGLPMLVESLGLGWKRKETKARGVNLTFEREGQTIEVAIANSPNMTSLAATLRGLADRPAEGTRLVLRDPRHPITKLAKKSREYLTKLTAQGARFIEPDVEVLALLEVLRGLLSDARSGDLTHEGMPLGVDAVEAWLRGALDPKVRGFLDELFAGDREIEDAERETTAERERVQDLAGLLEARFVLTLDAAARALEATEPEVESIARAHPTRFGLLSGPPAVLFRWVPPAASAATAEEVRS